MNASILIRDRRLSVLARAACLVLALFLVACSSHSNKIGETIKGERLAVIEQSKETDLNRAPKDSAVLSLSEEVVNSSWPQTGYDARHVIPHAQISKNPKPLWKASVGEGSSSDFKLLALPVVDQGLIFTMDAQGRVRCFDAKTGERKWQRDTTPKESEGPAIGGGLALEGDTVYATTGQGFIYALQAKTGNVKWQKALLKPLRAAPAVGDGRVYVVSIDNDLNALSTVNGEVLWHQTGVPESATLMGASSPAVQGDSVVVAYNSGEVFSLRVQNGRVAWNYSLAAPAQVGALPAIADIRGLPVIDKGRVYAISHSGRIASIDQRSGDRVWEADIGGINTPIVAENVLFIYGGDNQLFALARDSGRVIWVSQMQKYDDPKDKNSDPIIWTGPILAGGNLWMVNSQGRLTSFSPQDGSRVESIDLGEPIYLSPIVADHILYVVTDDGELIALR